MKKQFQCKADTSLEVSQFPISNSRCLDRLPSVLLRCRSNYNLLWVLLCAKTVSDGHRKTDMSIVDTYTYSHTFTPQNDGYQSKQEDYEPDTNLSAGFLLVTVKISFKGNQWSLCKTRCIHQIFTFCCFHISFWLLKNECLKCH